MTTLSHFFATYQKPIAGMLAFIALYLFGFDIAGLASVFVLYDSDSPSGGGDPSGDCSNAGDDNGGDTGGPGGPAGGGSTPFILTWNGKKYIYENDFLFAKPQSAYSNEARGREAYAAGLSGDRYVIQNELVPVDGEIKMQIREIELEESYIDQLQIGVIETRAYEQVIASADLDSFYLVDTKSASVIPQRQHLKRADGAITKSAAVSDAFLKNGTAETLERNDEIIIQVDGAALTTDSSCFLYLESNFRDWTLGDSLPFSRFDLFRIKSSALGKTIATTVAGTAVLFGGFVGGQQTERYDAGLSKLLQTPVAHADTRGGNGSDRCRSLVVSAQIGEDVFYLQTLFPRFLHFTGEILEIPKHIVEKAKHSTLALRIQATKKHVVRTAQVCAGALQTVEPTMLTLTKAVHHRTGVDYTESLAQKNTEFMKLIPGDSVDLVFKATAPTDPAATQQFILQSHGFYTGLSDVTKWQIGTTWQHNLTREDKRLLRRLKQSVTTEKLV